MSHDSIVIQADEIQRWQRRELDQQRERARQRPDVFPDTGSSEDDGSTLSPRDDASCFPVTEILWQGDAPTDAIRALAQSLVGRCVGIQGLNALQAQLRLRLVDDGLLTAWVRLPEQSLADGRLALHYDAGHIGRVHGEGTPGWWPAALPAGPGAILNQYDLDQALENIRRLKGQSDARIDIEPGLQAGTSDIVLQPGTGKRWHAYIGGDNAGLRVLGREQINAGLTLDSPLFLYDQFSVATNSSTSLRNHDNRSRAASVYYSVPFGYWTLFVGAARSHYRQTMPGFEEPIVYGGTTRQFDAGASVVAYRGSQHKGTVVAKALRKRVNGTINDFDIEVQRRDVTGYELGFQHRHYLGRTLLDVGVGVRGTMPRYSKQPGYVYGDPDWNGRTTILTANAGVSVPLTLAHPQMAYHFT